MLECRPFFGKQLYTAHYGDWAKKISTLKLEAYLPGMFLCDMWLSQPLRRCLMVLEAGMHSELRIGYHPLCLIGSTKETECAN
jgi:hypothetical protein